MHFYFLTVACSTTHSRTRTSYVDLRAAATTYYTRRTGTNILYVDACVAVCVRMCGLLRCLLRCLLR